MYPTHDAKSSESVGPLTKSASCLVTHGCKSSCCCSRSSEGTDARTRDLGLSFHQQLSCCSSRRPKGGRQTRQLVSQSRLEGDSLEVQADRLGMMEGDVSFA